MRSEVIYGVLSIGARYDARTRWPDGFAPLEHGAVFTK